MLGDTALHRRRRLITFSVVSVIANVALFWAACVAKSTLTKIGFVLIFAALLPVSTVLVAETVAAIRSNTSAAASPTPAEEASAVHQGGDQ